MSEILNKIIYSLKQSEAKTLADASGSVNGNVNEKDTAGASYLYKKEGLESTVCEIRFKDKVSGSALNRALLTSLKRYPYINTKVVENGGNYFFVQNPNSMTAVKSKVLRSLGTMTTGYHLVDVTYCEKSVFVAFHHGLCDGRGIKPFIETLIYYYSIEKFKSAASSEGIRLAEEALLEGETIDPFKSFYQLSNQAVEKIDGNGFTLPEINAEPSGEEGDVRFELEIDAKDYMKVVKDCGATPGIMTILLTTKAISNLNKNRNLPINGKLACDMRAALGCENTFKNCVTTLNFPFTNDMEDMPVRNQVKKLRDLMDTQKSEDYLKGNANSIVGLYKKLNERGGYKEKVEMMAFLDGMQVDTYVISYLGKFVLNENEQYIDSIHLYNSGAKGLGLNMVALEDKFIIDIKQTFKDDKYVKKLVEEFNALNVKCTCSRAIAFSTPKGFVNKYGLTA